MSLREPDQFSDYLVFVDESGDHGMIRVDPGYPMFVQRSACSARPITWIGSARRCSG